MTSEADNQQKRYNYAEQMQRLSRALRNNFYLEAVFIEYAIIEDRLESALRHAGAFNPNKQKTITAKLNKLEKICEEKSGLAQKNFSPELLASLRSWKDGRNPLIHELMKQKLSTEGLKEFALEGCQLVKTLKSKVGCFNRSIDRRKEHERKGL